MGKITVYLDKVTNLIDRDLIGKSDPFVTLHLEQDNFGPFDKNYGKKTSSVVKDDCNPVYGETFVWDNVPSLKNLVLWVTVTDDDPIKNDKLGKCKINVEEINPGPSGVGVDRVVDRNLLTSSARIFLNIKWEP